MHSRPRRNRKSIAIRDMIRETTVTPRNLIYPLFVMDGGNAPIEVKTMPNVYRHNLNSLLNEVEEASELGLRNIVLFPAVEDHLKDNAGSYGWDESNFYLNAIRQIKQRFPEVTIMTDVALDPYSSDGHDGLVKNGEILNDETLPLLAKQAIAQANAGADIIGPSDMMDGRIGYIREELDLVGYSAVSIMSYTAKYASAFYGPFRDALESAPKSGDKKTYQMDFANRKEALREAILDEQEGADFLMVKPALAYLDVIRDLAEFSSLPIAAYNVSGEYAMVKFAAQNGAIDYDRIVAEILTSIHRAGATSILSYFAKDFARLSTGLQ